MRKELSTMIKEVARVREESYLPAVMRYGMNMRDAALQVNIPMADILTSLLCNSWNESLEWAERVSNENIQKENDIYIVYGTYMEDHEPVTDILLVTNNSVKAQNMCNEAQTSAFMYSGVYVSRETME
jgi:hypothetical protein